MAQGVINTPRETTIQRIATALENILNKIVDTSSADNIDYDNTESDLTADKVQGAIDELASEKADKATTLAGYGITNAYTEAEVNDALNNNVETIAEAIKQWDIGSYTIDLYGIGLPGTYYPASSTYSGNRYLDVATGKMYDCEQTGPSTYTWRQAPVNLRLKTDINASAIEDIQEDISQSLSATGNPLTIESSESNLVECKAKVECVQEGSGDPSPTNIRPIIGQTEVVIEDVGKVNVIPDDFEQGAILATVGTYSDCKTESSTRIRTKELISLDTTKTTVISVNSGYDIVFQAFNSNGIRYDVTGSNEWVNGSINITGVPKIAIAIKNHDNTSNITPSDLPKTGFSFQENTHTIQLGETVYGGTLDVTRGELRVTHGEVDLGDLDWVIQNIDGNNCFRATLQNKDYTEDAICSQYSYSPRCSTDGTFSTGLGASTSLYVRDSRYSDTTAFKTAMKGVQLVYELAEPYTIQLTPQQIKLLKGTNHLSCNTGDLSIKYYPDNVLGQLKGDIESEYDERVETLETQMVGRPELKSLTITNKLTSNDGVAVINELPKAIIVGAYLYNTSNNNTVIAIPYLVSSGNLPFLKICSDSSTLSVLSGIFVSGIIYYFEI